MASLSPDNKQLLLALDERGFLLLQQYESLGDMDALNESIRLVEEILNKMSGADSQRLKMQANLGARLARRFDATGSRADLERAITISSQVLKATGPNDPELGARANNLGVQICFRFNLTGNPDDLNHAVELAQRAVDATPAVCIMSMPAGTQLRAPPPGVGRLSTLANRLCDRYESTGSLRDLNQSIEIMDKLTRAVPDHPTRPRWLSNLQQALARRYERTNAAADLDRALKIAQEAVNTMGAGDIHRAAALCGLGVQLAKRSERSRVHREVARSSEDLNKAITLFEEAVNITPPDHPDQFMNRINLALYTFVRSLRVHSVEDLNMAIEVTATALNSHPYHPHLSNIMGALLYRRFNWSRSRPDADAAVLHFQGALSNPSYHPISRRIAAGRFMLTVHAETGDWKAGFDASTVAVELIPKATLRSLEHTDMQELLGDVHIVGFGCDAAAAALIAGKGAHAALDLLERGRGVLAASIEELRTDVIHLHRANPELAQRFNRLRNELAVRDSKRHYYASQEFDEVIGTIRRLPDFQDFLLPPRWADVHDAARQGAIVVVNVSRYRSDAILVEKNNIRALHLPDISVQDLEKRVMEGIHRNGDVGTRATLEWLWDSVAGPVLEALGFTGVPSDNDWPHIWWIPTGMLAKFPLHAAGYHLHQGNKTVLSRVMSSYSSSLKTIVDSRRRDTAPLQSPATTQILLVSVPETDECRPLAFVEDETSMVSTLCESVGWEVVHPKEPQTQEVLSYLPTSKIFHFAGHGETDQGDPSQSKLLLKHKNTDYLTVQSLLETNLRQSLPFLAYLSACGTGRINRTKYLDESVHLIAACQLAGFRHVIGTLWSVDDDMCVEMADVTYQEMFSGGLTDEAVCRGLHMATRKLRDRWAEKSRISMSRLRSGLLCPAGSSISTHPANSTSIKQREAEIISDGESNEEGQGNKPEETLPWVPYVHFGV